MPVTTRRQSRSLLYLNAIDEDGERRSKNRPRRTTRESVSDDDPVDGSPVGSPSRKEAAEHRDGSGSGSVGPQSDVSEESNYEDEESEDNTDLDEDFEVTLRIPKRRKLEKAVTSASGKASIPNLAKTKRTGFSRRVQGRLQNMLSLPLDILFLIFSELGSMDLVNLARTSKDLRRYLMSRKNILIWIAARQNAGATRVPDPPEDMSEPAWALLLFGPTMCSECSTRNIQRVDFALRRRLCTACRKKSLVPSIKFRSQCADLNESIKDLLPHTTNGGWAHRRISNNRFYWKPDLYEMGKKIAELEEDRDAGKPGAAQRLECFRSERILLANSIVKRCPEFEKWAEAEAEAQAYNARERRTERRKALKERILAAGYDLADIDWIGMVAVPGANVDKPLTEDAWRHIRTKVEIKLSAAREARLLALRSRRKREYRAKSEQCYSNILQQVFPMQRLYLPSLSQVGELSCFRELLKPDRDVQPAEWEHAAARLPESLSEWMSEHRDRCARLLPSQVGGAQDKAMEVRLLSDPSNDLWRLGSMSDFAGKLDLATSVFRHRDTNTILIGRDVCHAWKMKGELEFFGRGAEATSALLQLLQLDPETTTASMLEQLDRHFICASCPEWRVYSWRCSVSHFIEQSENGHTQWRVMKRSDYGALSPHRSEAWLCNHCSEDLAPISSVPFGRISWAVSKTDAIRHVQTKHNIKDPIVDVDVFSYPMFN